jgi:hypothetical protein
MSHDEYLIKLDELETQFKNLKNDLHALVVLANVVKTNLGKLTLQEEHFAEALKYSREKAKVVELKVYQNTKQNLDECRLQAYNTKMEIASNMKKQQEAENFIKAIGDKIKSLKSLREEEEKDYGKLIHHDFRRDTGLTKKG